MLTEIEILLGRQVAQISFKLDCRKIEGVFVVVVVVFAYFETWNSSLQFYITSTEEA